MAHSALTTHSYRSGGESFTTYKSLLWQHFGTQRGKKKMETKWETRYNPVLQNNIIVTLQFGYFEIILYILTRFDSLYPNPQILRLVKLNFEYFKLKRTFLKPKCIKSNLVLVIYVINYQIFFILAPQVHSITSSFIKAC